jgi:hypothetical protein
VLPIISKNVNETQVNKFDFFLNIKCRCSRRMRLAGHVALRERGEVYTVFWWGNMRAKSQLEDPDVDGGIMWKWMWGQGLRWVWRRTERGGGHL